MGDEGEESDTEEEKERKRKRKARVNNAWCGSESIVGSVMTMGFGAGELPYNSESGLYTWQGCGGTPSQTFSS